MKKEFVLSLSQSYRLDLLDAIQLAEQGMLSPSQQAYCFEEIEDTKGTALYPANGDELFRKLRTALTEKKQISERQRAESELHKLGVELLFHIYINRFTFAEITHNTATDKFDAIIYLDECVTNEEKRANAAAMRRAFDAWLEESGYTADPAALTEVSDPCEGRFDTLAGAIAHIDHILRFPDLLLI
ncbi:hypothetical protein [Gemmiger sp.]|uniref:hypothetical protein n=1 Tax=Gemmiger sp. TaxID=2049027 RepID=UPI003FD8C15A